MMDGLLQLIVASGLLSGFGLAYKAFADRRLLKATAAAAEIAANASEATATALVVAAARELVDPLRKELAEVRDEAKKGVAVERLKLAEVRAELSAASDEARALRSELSQVRVELSRLYAENARYRSRISQLEGA